MIVTKSFDTKLTIQFPFSRPDLDPISRSIIDFKPDLKRKVDIKVGSQQASIEDVKKRKKKPLDEITDIKAGYDQVHSTSSELLNILSERAKDADLSMTLDPEKDPVTTEAVWALFAGHPSKLTFEMYKTLLEYEYDLGPETLKGMGTQIGTQL